jgi:hypothetical protein
MPTVEVSAQAVLAHAQERITELEASGRAIDDALRDCQATQVSGLHGPSPWLR